MTESRSLVERLRGANGWYFEPHMPRHEGNDNLLAEAASAIERLEKERDELVRDFGHVRAHLIAEEAALSSLKREVLEAIEPLTTIIAKYGAQKVRDLEDDVLALAWSDCEEDRAEESALLAVAALHTKLWEP